MPRPFSNSSRLHLETLEDRLVPSTMAGVYADGTWRYDTTAGWSHISTQQALQLDVDDAGNVYGKFSDGLWRWSAATASWAHPSSLTTEQFQVTASGIFYGDFGSNGVWRWDPGTNSWAQLSNLNPISIAVSDSDAFFGRFDSGSVGSWRWTPTAGWSLLTAYRPDKMQTDAAGDFVGLFSSLVPSSQAGTWRWSPTAGWAHLSTSVSFLWAVGANGAIFQDRTPTGIWRAAPGASSFSQLDTIDDINAALMALPDGSLFAERFVSGDGHITGWYWNSGLPGFGLFKFITIDQSVVGAIGKDGDLFFTDSTTGASGTGNFSGPSGYRVLGGLNTQIPLLLASQR
jgi:hypothetical protein